MEYLSVGDVANILDVPPPKITDLFYKREVRADQCPVVGGRRLIPPRYVAVIAMVLRGKGIKVRNPETVGAT